MPQKDTIPDNTSIPPAALRKWTEIELLPAWDEPFYDVYTAKKFGKWVMLKTLKSEYKDDPAYIEMINKEFDVRYNLAHPNIVMINDFEEVPGLGMCIITDDVYGLSLRRLLDEGKLTDRHYAQLCTRLPMALEYIQQNHLAHNPIRPETIIFTENIGNLKLIDVGFDQKNSLSQADTSDDVVNFGRIMLEVLERTGRHDPLVSRVAQRCVSGDINSVQSLQVALSGRSNRPLYVVIIALLIAVVVILAWTLMHDPTPKI